jgi:hypothetical protein
MQIGIMIQDGSGHSVKTFLGIFLKARLIDSEFGSSRNTAEHRAVLFDLSECALISHGPVVAQITCRVVAQITCRILANMPNRDCRQETRRNNSNGGDLVTNTCLIHSFDQPRLATLAMRFQKEMFCMAEHGAGKGLPSIA